MEPPDDTHIGTKLSQNDWFAYNTLTHIFRLLSIPDLLRVSQVCKLWNQIANDPTFWRSVELYECKVNFKKMADMLESRGTIHLKLLECIFVLNNDALITALKNMPSLRKIELSECSSALIERLPEANPNLEVIRANIICGLIGISLDLNFVTKLPNITELSLYCNRELASPGALTNLKKLQNVSLVGVKNLNFVNLQILADHKLIRNLALGDCWNLPKTFGPDILQKMTLLERLRLESCRECNITEILQSVGKLPKLECLELIEINVDNGFENALPCCHFVKQLTIVPNPHRLKMATFNSKIAQGVLPLKDSLKNFTWGFTPKYLEYISKVLEHTNCVPIMSRSIALNSAEEPGEMQPTLITLPVLQTIVARRMPNTKVLVESKDYTGTV